MNRSFLKSLHFSLMLLFAHTASAQFINGDLEQWDTTGMFGERYLDPAGWTTDNYTTIFGFADTPVTRGMDSTGYFARIESNSDGIDVVLPGRMWQTIDAHHLSQILYHAQCDSLSMAGACVVNLYKRSSNELLYTGQCVHY